MSGKYLTSLFATSQPFLPFSIQGIGERLIRYEQNLREAFQHKTNGTGVLTLEEVPEMISEFATILDRDCEGFYSFFKRYGFEQEENAQ